MEKPKRINVNFFKNSSGKEPVRQWLMDLNKEERRQIGEDIKTVEYGWPIGMPVCRPLGDKLFEVRTELKNTIARVLFCIVGNQMLLLHGFIKKTEKTPQNELTIARRRFKEACSYETK
jgi:phage-related protein